MRASSSITRRRNHSGAAESWTISPDGKVYTFKLRAGNVWSDGSPVTADDFVFSMRRALDPATAAEYAAMLYPIAGAEEANKDASKLGAVGVKALDPNTVEITLKNATPYFLEMLTLQVMYPVSKANVEKFGADFTKPGNLVSNGAYTLVSNTPGDKIVAQRTPDSTMRRMSRSTPSTISRPRMRAPR